MRARPDHFGRGGDACAVALVLLLTSCGTWYSGLAPGPNEASAAYRVALEQHTRRGWRTREFESTVALTATIMTPGFLDAVNAEKARLHLMPPESTRPDLGAPLEAQGLTVVVFIEANEPAWERLDRSDPVWRFTLETPGSRSQPIAVASVDSRDPTIGHLFPYVSRFGRAWLLTFPESELGERPVLWMTGAPARLRLEFDLSG